jgi:geranylgeranylglycerol-phosphate geranylgeranyltransferase
MFSRIFGFLQLIRPINGILGAVSAGVGGILAGGLGVTREFPLLLSSVSVFLIMSGANAINDFFDLEIDRINRPSRPIPSGRVKLGEALLVSLIFVISGIMISYFIHLWDFLIALTASILLFLYSLLFKQKGFIGNLIVSLLSGLVFLYGGLAIFSNGSQIFQFLPYLLYPFSFAFLFHLGREILKDTADMEGDTHKDAHTIPLLYGKLTALRFSFGIFLLLIVLTPIPYILHYYNLYYLIIVLLGVDLFLLLLFIFLFRNPAIPRISRAGIFLKWNMGIGLLALIVGRI